MPKTGAPQMALYPHDMGRGQGTRILSSITTSGLRRDLQSASMAPRITILVARAWIGFYLNGQRVWTCRPGASGPGGIDFEWILEKLSIPFQLVEVMASPEKLCPGQDDLELAYSRHWYAVWLGQRVIWQGPEDRLDYRELLSILEHLTPYATANTKANGLSEGSAHAKDDLPMQLPADLILRHVGSSGVKAPSA